MFIGHYSISLLAKSKDKTIPIWVLFIAVQLVDVLWAVFVFAGIEKVRIVHGFTRTNPLDLYFMPYTHSLAGSLFWSAVAFALYYAFRGSSSGGRFTAAFFVGLAVLSHWFLDLIVHVPDLALYDDTLKMGFGLWNYPEIALPLELVLLAFGVFVYMRSTVPVSVIGRFGMPVLAVMISVLQVYVFFGPDPAGPDAMAATALGSYVAIAAVAEVLDRQRKQKF